MQKISSILPSSPRVLSVDMKESNPIRPGMPSFGRPEGVSTVRQRNDDLSFKASEAQGQMNDWRTKDTQKAAMAKEISDRFFQERTKESVQNKIEAKPVESEEQIAEAPIAEGEEAVVVETLNPPGGPFPKGSFIDQRI